MTEARDPSTGSQPGDFDVPDFDGLLVLMANAVGKLDTGSTMAITLNVRGATISGTMIAAQAWRRELVGMMREHGGSQFVEDLAMGFENLDTKDAAEAELPPEVRPLPKFIHLRDAHLLGGDIVSPLMYGLWRGRLSQVDGWTYGATRARPESQGPEPT